MFDSEDAEEAGVGAEEDAVVAEAEAQFAGVLALESFHIAFAGERVAVGFLRRGAWPFRGRGRGCRRGPPRSSRGKGACLLAREVLAAEAELGQGRKQDGSRTA